MEASLYVRLGISLGIGLLVGMQRERSHDGPAGIRTFALIALSGTLCGMLAAKYSVWIAVAGLLVTGFLGGLSFFRHHDEDAEAGEGRGRTPGLTTEFAMLLVYGLGVYLADGDVVTGIAIGAVTAVLLQFKKPLHDFVARIGEKDLLAVMQFIVLALVILPVLPNANYGPYDVWNPFEIWLLVVFIVGISLGGYLTYKIVGPEAGAVLGGILGGLISSTATTVSYSRRAALPGAGQAALRLTTFVVLIAGAVVYGRILVEIGVVAPGRVLEVAPPLVLMLALTAVVALIGYLRMRGAARTQDGDGLPEMDNPAQLKAAFVFGLLYAVVLLAVEFAQDRFGEAGMYIVAVISGLTDVDAITLSTSRLVQNGAVEAGAAARTILTASLSNLVFKWLIVFTIGGKKLGLYMLPYFGAVFLGGVALLFYPFG